MSDALLRKAAEYLERARRLQERYRAGEIHARVPEDLHDQDAALEDLVEECFPDSHRALEEASQSLFYSLPIAFDPAESVGPFLATADRDPANGEPWRFIDMGALIATHAFGENEPAVAEAILKELPYAVTRFAHSEYQTSLSLRLKKELNRIAPKGTPRHFVVNTGAEAVENAIKSVLLNRVKTYGQTESYFIISFEGAFHGRTLGSLAVTHRKKARLGFPTFDWPKVPFPTDDPQRPAETDRREEKSLHKIWELLQTGRHKEVPKPPKELWKKELEAIDGFLEKKKGDLEAFVAAQRAKIAPEVLKRALRAAGVLIEPVQGEGGVRLATFRFYRRLRVLTKIYDVPLMFDEVQSGWGATGRLWAHEHFDLPAPPDLVSWAKKAQNGVLFVSEDLATFFQEEKKFNTTWEGDSVGMVRLIAMLGKLDLDQVRKTSERSVKALEGLARDFPELVSRPRGLGVMLAFDVARPDWRDWVRERAFRLGLILLPAGERTLRFYPRYDTEPYVIEESVAILRRALEDAAGKPGSLPVDVALPGPEIRQGSLEIPLASLETIDLNGETWPALRAEVMAVEIDRYGGTQQYPKDVLRSGRRPLLQYPLETLDATIGNPRSIGVTLRDRVSGKLVAYGLGSPLENHDEEGVRADPHHGENNTFYLQALATVTTVRNQGEVEGVVLEAIRNKAKALGFEHLSALLEQRTFKAGPPWLREAAVLRKIDNYLRSGIRFAYVQLPL